MTDRVQFGTGFNNNQSVNSNLALNPQDFDLSVGGNQGNLTGSDGPLFSGGQGFGQQPGPQFGGGGFSRGMSNFSLGAQGLAALYGVYNANKLRKRGDEQFSIEKDIIDRNLANESLAYNDVIRQRLIMSQRQRGIDPNSAQGQEETAGLATRLVDGSPVT